MLTSVDIAATQHTDITPSKLVLLFTFCSVHNSCIFLAEILTCCPLFNSAWQLTIQTTCTLWTLGSSPALANIHKPLGHTPALSYSWACAKAALWVLTGRVLSGVSLPSRPGSHRQGKMLPHNPTVLPLPTQPPTPLCKMGALWLQTCSHLHVHFLFSPSRST